MPLDRRREIRAKLDESGLCLEHTARPAAEFGAAGTEEDPVTGLRNELLFYGRGDFGALAAIRLSGSPDPPSFGLSVIGRWRAVSPSLAAVAGPRSATALLEAPR